MPTCPLPRFSLGAAALFWAASLPACSPSYVYAPATHATGEVAGRLAAEYEIPPDEPSGDVRVGSLGVTEITPQGAPLRLAELTLTVDLPDKKIAPINVPLRDLGPGHYLSPGFDFPFGGNWRITARTRLDEINEVTLVGSVGIK